MNWLLYTKATAAEADYEAALTRHFGTSADEARNDGDRNIGQSRHDSAHWGASGTPWSAASNIVHVYNSRQRLDGGTGSGVDLEAAGNGDFDFAGGEVEDDGDAAAAAGLAGEDAFEGGESAGFADEDRQARGGEGDERVDRDDQWLTGIEQGTGLTQYFREQRYLVSAARVGHLDKGEAVAAPGGALL